MESCLVSQCKIIEIEHNRALILSLSCILIIIAGQDFEGVTDMPIYFLNGSDYIIITVNITDDNLTEGVEQFTGVLTINNQANSTQNFNTSITIEILDNDSKIKVTSVR